MKHIRRLRSLIYKPFREENQMKRQENEKLNILGALVSGGLIGAGIALLLAPQSGSETRRSISRMGRIARNEADNYRIELSNKMDRIFKDFQSDLKDSLDDGKSWTEDKKSKFEHALQKNRRKIEVELDRILHS